MKSLARQTVWWPGIDNDIAQISRDCSTCARKPRNHIELSPWPLAIRPMQRVHADYCGPLFNNIYALIIVDSFSRYPEVFLTRQMTTEFTIKAFRKFYSREGIAQVLVTDNGRQFTSGEFQNWCWSIGCRQLFTAPRHPQSNGLAENMVKTIKTACAAANPTTLEDLERALDNFLMQYRNAAHTTTHQSPAFLFKGRNLRSSLSYDITDITFQRGNNLQPSSGIIVRRLGQNMVELMDISDGSIHRRHRDQIHVTSQTNQSTDIKKLVYQTISYEYQPNK